MAGLAACFQTSTELDVIIRAAVAASTPDRTQAWGNRVEGELGKLLADPGTAARVSADLVAVSAGWDSARTVTAVKIQVIKGTAAPQDLLLRIRFDDGSGYVLMVNVKVLASETTNYGNGVSLSTFLRMATEPDFDPAAQTSARGYDPDSAVLEMLAGTRKIIPGRDYYILHVQTTAELTTREVVAWHFQGLLSHITEDGHPCVRRHTSRDVVQVFQATRVLPPGYDINREIALAMMPTHRPGAVRARIVAALATNSKEGRSLAGTLLAMSDAELAARIFGLTPKPEHG
jgi:hypothetical protein